MANGVPSVKGTAIVGLVKMARQMREAFVPELPAETQAFIETPIMLGSWYPAVHHRNLLLAADRIRGTGDLEYCRKLGTMAARANLTNVYKRYVTPGDVPGSLHNFADFWPLFHDTGVCTWDDPAPGYVRLRVEAFGFANRPVCATHVGWLEGVVELAGGQGHATDEECLATGGRACVYGVRW
jgi:predicted hydrocarbon binding protein